jgi:hypothetical protein
VDDDAGKVKQNAGDLIRVISSFVFPSEYGIEDESGIWKDGWSKGLRCDRSGIGRSGLTQVRVHDIVVAAI